MSKLNGWGTTYAVAALCAATAMAAPAQTFTTLHSFDIKDGSVPIGGLVQASDGSLYGTTSEGGANYVGTVFKITPSGTLTTLYSFCPQQGCPDGKGPLATLIQATDGNFYGTTYNGGANKQGTVFKITPGGKPTTLYTLCSQMGCADGAGPNGLVQGTDGNFYGTTYYGGANGYGTVFEITPAGTLTQAIDGNFYGTTLAGGAFLLCGLSGCGTVFEITPSGELTTLWRFCAQAGCPEHEGIEPSAPLVEGTDGGLYGTTQYGGADASGTVFRITPTGTLATLYSFCSSDGCGFNPFAGLVQDTNGKFYGTTPGGGLGSGTVFGLSLDLGPFVETQPASGPAGKVVKILGTNLTGATSVTFNGTASTFTVETASLIKATVPAGATTGKVQVVTPSGTLSSNVPFRVAP